LRRPATPAFPAQQSAVEADDMVARLRRGTSGERQAAIDADEAKARWLAATGH
jgi:hypothetical protein